jgi:hypothetical protein
MVFKFATRSPAAHTLGAPRQSLPVIDTNTLRQAALETSWLRDQRVARRRLAIRWTLWWLWKCRYYLLAVCAILILLFYQFTYLQSPSAAAPAVITVPATVTPSPSAVVAPHSGVQLRMQEQLLLSGGDASHPDTLPAEVRAPFQLRPETQLKNKETSP